MRGIIDEIITNDLQDGRKYQTLVIDGKKYSLWDKNYLDKYTEGDTIDFASTNKQVGDILEMEVIYQRVQA